MEHESDGDSNWRPRRRLQIIGTKSRGLGNLRRSGDHPNKNIVEIGQNTKKSPGDLWNLSVNQTPVENH